MVYYVYLIKTLRGYRRKSYVGYSNNLSNRINKHNSNLGAKSTKGYKWELVYKKRFFTKQKALSFEYKLKKDRRERLKIIYDFKKKVKILELQLYYLIRKIIQKRKHLRPLYGYQNFLKIQNLKIITTFLVILNRKII